MLLPGLLAKHFTEVFFGGNWTSVNLQDTLKDITWQEATTRVSSLHTIAELTFHINYYVSVITRVMNGGPLDAHDKYSFDLPPISSRVDWDELQNKTFTDARQLATLIEQLSPDKLDKDFVEEKYGTYYRNLQGVIEHTHYHLGQIVLIKKMLPGIKKN